MELAALNGKIFNYSLSKNDLTTLVLFLAPPTSPFSLVLLVGHVTRCTKGRCDVNAPDSHNSPFLRVPTFRFVLCAISRCSNDRCGDVANSNFREKSHSRQNYSTEYLNRRNFAKQNLHNNESGFGLMILIFGAD